jgi:hypothetical protein
MRHHIQGRGPRRLRARAGATAAAGVTTAATGCSSDPAPGTLGHSAHQRRVPGARVAPLVKSNAAPGGDPAIGVDSPLMELGLWADGTMQARRPRLPGRLIHRRRRLRAS